MRCDAGRTSEKLLALCLRCSETCRNTIQIDIKQPRSQALRIQLSCSLAAAKPTRTGTDTSPQPPIQSTWAHAPFSRLQPSAMVAAVTYIHTSFSIPTHFSPVRGKGSCEYPPRLYPSTRPKPVIHIPRAEYARDSVLGIQGHDPGTNLQVWAVPSCLHVTSYCNYL